jgi:hypothetical protein
MTKVKIIYRVYNFYADNPRERITVIIHPDLKEMIEEIANDERKSVGWVVETALADYFGYKIPLRKTKTTARPEFTLMRKRN